MAKDKRQKANGERQKAKDKSSKSPFSLKPLALSP